MIMHGKKLLMLVGLLVTGVSYSRQEKELFNHTAESGSKKTVFIVLGSTRQGRSSDKIGLLLKRMADTRADVVCEIVDLRDYSVPFLSDSVAPSYRKVITDPVIKRWSEKINSADAFIIVVPEYNAGYPGELKNALDSLYVEWNNKPVAFVGYSGGQTGGKSAIDQLRTVVQACQMIPVDTCITIPTAWKALDDQGNFVDKTITKKLHRMIDQLIVT